MLETNFLVNYGEEVAILLFGIGNPLRQMPITGSHTHKKKRHANPYGFS